MTLRGFTYIVCLAVLQGELIAQFGARAVPDASAIWERVLIAKGGRQRLEAIENMLAVTIDSKRQQILDVDLYIFPNRFWSWDGRQTSWWAHDAFAHDPARFWNSLSRLRFQCQLRSRD